MAKLIGTAGHVDHGKTTLIRVLTGIDADRLPEEKERGMTIDIGFAYVDLPRSGRVSIVDVPGHERFLSNMLVGALGMDLVLLCVAADESVMPQTIEHLQILELLPVQRLIAVLTRCDLADSEMQELVESEVQGLLDGSRFAGAKIVRFASNGMGLDDLRSELDVALDYTDTKTNGDWYMPVDRAFTVKGHGSVLTGTLGRGKVSMGEDVAVEPDGFTARVKGIHVHGHPVESSYAGQRTALNITGLKLEQLRRGQLLGKPGTITRSNTIDAAVRWVDNVKHGMRVRVSIGAEEVMGRIFLSESDAKIVQLRLENPVGCVSGQPLIIRRYSPPDLLGGGEVAVPLAKRRKRKDPVIAPISSGMVEEQLLAAVGSAMNGLPTEDICRSLGRTQQALGPIFEQLLKEKKVLGFAGIWFTPDGFAATAERLLANLLKVHDRNPSRAYVPRDEMLSPDLRMLSGKPLDRMLQHLAELGKVVIMGIGVRHCEFQVSLNPKQQALLERVCALLESTGVSGQSAAEIARALGVPTPAVEEILRLGMEIGRIARVSSEIFYASSFLKQLASDMRSRFGDRGFTAAEFRDAYKTSRKYVIPLLEYFDVEGVTMRTGDVRHMRRPTS